MFYYYLRIALHLMYSWSWQDHENRAALLARQQSKVASKRALQMRRPRNLYGPRAF